MPVNPNIRPEESAEHYAGDETHFAQKEETEENIDPYRKQFVNLVVSQEEEIEKELENLALLIEAEVRKTGLDQMMTSIVPIIKNFFLATFAGIILEKNIEAAIVSGKWQSNQAGQDLDATSEQDYKKSVSQAVADIGNTLFFRKDPFNGIPVGQKIVTLSGGTLNAARNMIRVGIEEGWSSRQLSNNLRDYVIRPDKSSWVSPFSYFRKAFGYVRKQPSSIPAGSVEYNCMRIARTEINNTWREAVLRANRDKPWVDGFEWVLSPSHPVYDICDEWAAGSPYEYDEISQFGHPHCMCHIRVKFKKDLEELWG
jgi:hypothetical protein